MATTNYNLPTITGNMTADVVRDFNALAEATDTAIKVAVDSVDLSQIEQEISAVDTKVNEHLADYAQFKSETESGKVSKSGDTMQGILTAHSNTSYTLRQVRNIVLSTDDADVNAMLNGDIWIKYE